MRNLLKSHSRRFLLAHLPVILAQTTGNAQRMNSLMPQGQSAGSGKFPLGLNQVAALKALGVDMLDVFKYATDGSKRDAGAYYVNPMNGKTTYMPKVGEGMTMLQDGSIALVPGAAQANAAYKGAEAGAVEGAKANYDLLKPTEVPWVGERPGVMTRGQAVRGAQPGGWKESIRKTHKASQHAKATE